MRSLIRFLISAIALLCFGGDLFSQELVKSFGKVKTRVGDVVRADFSSNLDDKLTKDAIKAKDELDYSINELTKFEKYEAPKAYVDSVNQLVAALDAIDPKSDLKRERKLVVIQFVSDDFKSKLTYAQAKPTAPYSLIKATVNTLTKDNKSVAGYSVWYVPKAWEDDKKRYQRFNKNSTPTVEELAPGNYYMWSEKDMKTGIKQPVKLDKPNVEVDLPTP